MLLSDRTEMTKGDPTGQVLTQEDVAYSTNQTELKHTT